MAGRRSGEESECVSSACVSGRRKVLVGPSGIFIWQLTNCMAFYIECWGDCGRNSNCQYCGTERRKEICTCGCSIRDHENVGRKMPACQKCNCKKYEKFAVRGAENIGEGLTFPDHPVVPRRYTMKDIHELPHIITDLEYYRQLEILSEGLPDDYVGLERFLPWKWEDACYNVIHPLSGEVIPAGSMVMKDGKKVGLTYISVSGSWAGYFWDNDRCVFLGSFETKEQAMRYIERELLTALVDGHAVVHSVPLGDDNLFGDVEVLGKQFKEGVVGAAAAPSFAHKDHGAPLIGSEASESHRAIVGRPAEE
jgi:hypothetical protein